MDRKKAILNTTLQLLTRQGFYATPMSQIAKEAGVAAGTIYHYFAGKEELILSLRSEINDEIIKAIKENIDIVSDAKTQFYQIWLHIFKFYVREPIKFQFIQQFDNSPYLSQLEGGQKEQLYLPLLEFMSESYENGILKNLPVKILTSLVISQIHTIVNLQIADEEDITRELLRDIIELSWANILK